MGMKILIVDDEPIARGILRECLELLPDVQVVGEASNGKEALQKIGRLTPDVVFLDLQMPVMSGFEVVQSLSGPALPVIVIVTAFDQHAIEAFEAGAIDYLLKPVSEQRLRRAVERARRVLTSPGQIAAEVDKIASLQPPGAPRNRKVVGRGGEEYFLVDLDDVLAFQAERELVWIITPKQRLLATQSLRIIAQRLQEDSQFQRVHRNAIVNINHIRKMSALSSQRWLITLSNALQLIVSKRQAHNIRDILRW
jgi:two-component system, LytTR family, response regulator